MTSLDLSVINSACTCVLSWSCHAFISRLLGLYFIQVWHQYKCFENLRIWKSAKKYTLKPKFSSILCLWFFYWGCKESLILYMFCPWNFEKITNQDYNSWQNNWCHFSIRLFVVYLAQDTCSSQILTPFGLMFDKILPPNKIEWIWFFLDIKPTIFNHLGCTSIQSNIVNNKIVNTTTTWTTKFGNR